MKTVEKFKSGRNFNAISVGEMSKLSDFQLTLGPSITIPGKVFVGKELETTGTEMSFQSFAPNTETGFLHTHKNHEELYILISGNGEFQVDDEIFKVGEGSIVRVSPDGRRSIRNNGNKQLVSICIQYRSKSFDESDANDGIILQDKVKW